MHGRARLRVGGTQAADRRAAARCRGSRRPRRAIENVNWVLLRADDDFADGISGLERALDLDLDLVRIHTRVLTRAKAWELAGRRPTPLLRGDELRTALAWLTRAAAGAEPQPTELQGAFVEESRLRAARRQRLAVAGSLTFTLLAIALATFALIQRQDAINETHIAQSQLLAREAVSPGDIGFASLLAIEAYRLAPTVDARSAILT